MRHSRKALAAVVAAAGVLSVGGIAGATWTKTSTGTGSSAAGTISGPTSVLITACTGIKSAGTVSGTVTVTWHVSTDARATGQKTYLNSTANSTIANNTTASATLSYNSFAPGSYTAGVQTTTSSNWMSAIVNSSNTFVPATSGSSGGCSVGS